MNVLSLKFPDQALEKAFHDDYFFKTLHRTRYSIAVGVFLFAFFGILDPRLIPGSVHKAWLVRYAVVCPFLAACFFFTFSPYYRKYMQQAKALALLICGLAVIAMTVILQAPAAYQYYSGLILVLMFVYTVTVISFPYAVAVSWLLIGLYALTALTLTAIPVQIFFKNIFFLVSTNLIGMTSCYLGESHLRKNFLQTRELQEQAGALEREMEVRKKAERALMESGETAKALVEIRTRELRLSEEKFSKLFHSSPDCMSLSALADGRVIVGDSALGKTSGYAREELLGRTSVELNLWAEPEDRLKFLNALRKERHVSNMEVKLRNAAGEHRAMLASAELIEIRGEPSIILILRDMSEVHKAMRSFHLAVLGEMAAGAAHEMNNPNSVVMLNSTFLLRVWNDIRKVLADCEKDHGPFTVAELPFPDAGEVMTNMLLGIAESSERIKNIIDNMKSLSKQDRQVHEELVDVNEAVGNAIRLLSNRIKNHTRCFYSKYASGLPKIRGKAMQVEQTAINVITNALQSLKDERGSVTVSTYYEADNGLVVIEVMDEGAGIPEDLQGRVFEPFFTTRTDGTGLGLSISHRIVSQHRGSIDIASGPEAGTTVQIRLPAAQEGC